MASMQPIALEYLGRGEAVRQFNNELIRAVKDMEERPNLKGKRSVVLRVEFTPENDEQLDIVTSNINWNVNPSFPAVAGATQRGIIKNGQLMINTEASPSEDPRQMQMPSDVAAEDEAEDGEEEPEAEDGGTPLNVTLMGRRGYGEHPRRSGTPFEGGRGRGKG